MVSFNDVFGGGNIYPSDPTYLSLTMSTDQVLQWPVEQQIGGNVAAAIVDIDATTPGLNIDLSDARQISTGYTSLFNNVGANTVTIRNAIGGTIVSLVSGTVWEIYLVDNSTQSGTWRVFQFGASVSVAVAAALAGAGLKAIGTTLNEKIVISPKGSNYVLVDSDRATLILWTGGAGSFTLPTPATVGADWFAAIRNSGSGDLVVTPSTGQIDGEDSKAYSAGTSSFVVTDGTNYYTLGFGSGGSGGIGFNFISIDISGSGDLTLSGAQLNRVSYSLTGILTGNRNIIVPTAIQEYWITNNTTGAFSVTIKTAAGTGIIVTQGTSAILYCDGTNVVIAQSTATAFPITIGQGGTNATTASAARSNLGATSTGDAVFTAVTAAAGLAALSGVPTSRSITASTGLSGGGDLSADRALAIDTTAALTWTGHQIFAASTGNPILVDVTGSGRAAIAINNTTASPNPTDAYITVHGTDSIGNNMDGVVGIKSSVMGVFNTSLRGISVDHTFGSVSITAPTGNQLSCSIDTAGTGAGLAVGGFLLDKYYKDKISATPRNSTVTVTDDPDLVLTSNIPAGIYHVRALLLFAGTTTGTQGFQGTLFFSSTSSFAYFGGVGSQNGVPLNITAAGDWGTNKFLASTISTSVANPDYMILEGCIKTTAAGVISVQWAQGSSSANNTSLLAGSSMIIERLS